MKEEGTERGNGRDLVSAPMTGQGNVIIEKIGTTEIVTGRRTGIRRENVGGREIVIENVCVNVIEVGTVVATMSVIVTESVDESMIVIAPGRGRGRGIMKVVTTIVDVPTREMIMIVLTRNTRRIAVLRGTMITLSQRMTLVGMNNLSRDAGGQMQSMISVIIIMNITEVRVNMITWMFKVTMTVMINILAMILIVMIKWTMMIIIMIVEHPSHVKEIMNISARRGHFPGTMIIESATLL